MDNISTKAVKAALSNNWQEAIALNQKILNLNPKNVRALNRLAYAFVQVGDYQKACQVYKNVLSIDKYNQIASKNLTTYSQQPQQKRKSRISQTSISPSLFLKEPGKTKIVSLVNVAPQTILVTLKVCQPIKMVSKRRCIEIRDIDNTYIGAFPDDLSFYIKNRLLSGYHYQAYIKGISKNGVTVFMREISKE